MVKTCLEVLQVEAIAELNLTPEAAFPAQQNDPDLVRAPHISPDSPCVFVKSGA